ncbi:MAG TPA: protein-glutamate O-methyltransferase CheR, partial [Anaerolineae bacterium]|nr:protein-glutamate O-methyltransferase CheR [Anaerolineae bacterium]
MDDLTYNYIKRQIGDILGIDLNQYKAPQMQRRLTSYLGRLGYSNWPMYFRVVRSDEAVAQALRDYLTINVSSFMRDQNKFLTLERDILPQLGRPGVPLRIWSAGCSRGQEPYTVAMMLAERDGIANHHRILATDIDDTTLNWARAGGPYSEDDVKSLPRAWLNKYVDKRDGKYWVQDLIRRKPMFRQNDMLKLLPQGKFDLIICRNVVIYFKPEVKDILYRRFYEALRPGGGLFVGGTEIV